MYQYVSSSTVNHCIHLLWISVLYCRLAYIEESVYFVIYCIWIMYWWISVFHYLRILMNQCILSSPVDRALMNQWISSSTVNKCISSSIEKFCILSSTVDECVNESVYFIIYCRLVYWWISSSPVDSVLMNKCISSFTVNQCILLSIVNQCMDESV